MYNILQFLKALADLFCEVVEMINSFQRYIDTLSNLERKMKIDGLSCDKCNKSWHSEPMRVGGLPSGWFSLTKGSNGLVEQDKHFCCIECLVNWTSLQTVDSRKFDMEGPVEGVVMSVEKQDGRLVANKRKSDL
jgi:hypothetical protein